MVIQIADIEGDVNVQVDETGLPRFIPLAKPQTITAEEARARPSILLRPQREVVDLVGRQRELLALAAWRQQGDPVSLMLVFGPLGQGKTRLAVHFQRVSAGLGWAPFTHLRPPVTGDAERIGASSDRPTDVGKTSGSMLLLDDADSYSLDALLGAINSAARSLPSP